MLIGWTIKDDAVLNMLGQIRQRCGDMTPGMKIVGQLVARSVRRNFDDGGRPTAWKPSRRALRTGGKTLLDRARLQRSITSRAFPDRAEIGTTVVYGPAHQLGFHGTVSIAAHSRMVKSQNVKQGRKKVASGVAFIRAHSRTMNLPARPYLLVQPEDWPAMTDALGAYLAGGRRS